MAETAKSRGMQLLQRDLRNTTQVELVEKIKQAAVAERLFVILDQSKLSKYVRGVRTPRDPSMRKAISVATAGRVYEASWDEEPRATARQSAAA